MVAKPRELYCGIRFLTWEPRNHEGNKHANGTRVRCDDHGTCAFEIFVLGSDKMMYISVHPEVRIIR